MGDTKVKLSILFKTSVHFLVLKLAPVHMQKMLSNVCPMRNLRLHLQRGEPGQLEKNKVLSRKAAKLVEADEKLRAFQQKQDLLLSAKTAEHPTAALLQINFYFL